MQTSSQKLIATSVLPDKYSNAFSFSTFNAVQSKCYDIVMNSNDNIVLCAPTGCGKTVIGELGIINSLIKAKGKPKLMLYVSPLRSLCQEKVYDWKRRFEPLGLTVQEYTGDTNIPFPTRINEPQLLCTTPEKFDLATRRWQKRADIFAQISLVIVDEIHILGESRGAVLEAMLSRILFISDQNEEIHNQLPIRLIALSATIPNYKDIAQWLRVPVSIAEKTVFDDNYRSTDLETMVFGYQHNYHKNEWQFESSLTTRVAGVIKSYSMNLPTLVFCCTRKSCIKTANKLAEDIIDLPHPQIPNIKDKELANCLRSGIGFHTGGLCPTDRQAVENMFSIGQIRILCTTSTLAQGINLPAYLVIIKGTKHYDGSLIEYEATQILQMAGRAGRPQFHNQGKCIIMTDKSSVRKFEDIFQSSAPIESSLMSNLLEHMNAEIALGFVKSSHDVIRWLRSTYLYIRMQENPQHYGIQPGIHLDNAIKNICLKNLSFLKDNKFISMNGQGIISSLPAGTLCSQYGLIINTMVTFSNDLHPKTLSDLLLILCKADEFLDIIVRSEEKIKLRGISSSPFIRFKVKNSDDPDFFSPATKVFLMIEAALANGKLDDFNLNLEFNKIKKTADRLLSCYFMLEVNIGDFKGAELSLLLCKCINQQLWENENNRLPQQIKGIGEVYARKISDMGAKTFPEIRDLLPFHIESITGHRTGWGIPIVEEIKKIPEYKVTIQSEVPDEVCVTIHNLSAGEPTLSYHKAEVLIGIESKNELIARYEINHVIGHMLNTYRAPIPLGYTIEDITVKCIDRQYVGIDVIQKGTTHNKSHEKSTSNEISREIDNDQPKFDEITVDSDFDIPDSPKPEIMSGQSTPNQNRVHAVKPADIKDIIKIENPKEEAEEEVVWKMNDDDETKSPEAPVVVLDENFWEVLMYRSSSDNESQQ